MTVVADLLTPFCEAGCISAKDASRAVRKRVLVSLTFVDSQALHERLFGEQHMDWAGVQDYLSEACFTCHDWMHLIGLLDFVNEQQARGPVLEQLASAMAGMRIATTQLRGSLTPLDSMRMCFARARLAPSWDVLCKALLLCNLVDVDHTAALQELLRPDGVTGEQVAELVRSLPTCRHTRVEYTDAFAQILHDAQCQVRAHLVAQSLRRREAAREAQRQHALRACSAFRKPSLTAILEAKQAREGERQGQDSFGSFCSGAKLAANANVRLKQVAYYLACLPPHPDKRAQLARVVGGDAIVLAAIEGMTIVVPDLKALRAIICDTHHTGPPFDGLRQFRASCVASACLVVTGTGRRVVHWTTVLRLYLASYCRDEACKDLWAHTVAASADDSGAGPARLHAAPEAESAMRAFARENPMALAEAVALMLAS